MNNKKIGTIIILSLLVVLLFVPFVCGLVVVPAGGRDLYYVNGSYVVLDEGVYDSVERIDNVWYVDGVAYGENLINIVPITEGELSSAMLFVLGFMSIFCLISMVWLVNTRAGAVVGFFIGLFTFFVALYSALGGVYTLGVPQGWFGLFVALFGGLTMLLVGLGVRVKR